MGGWWRWALVSLDGVAPSRMVSVSAHVNLLRTIKSRSSLLVLAHPHPCGPRKRAVKWLWWWCDGAHRGVFPLCLDVVVFLGITWDYFN